MHSPGTINRLGSCRREGLSLALLLCGLILLSACSSPQQRRTEPSDTTGVGSNALIIEAGRLRELRSVASPMELDALEDGTVDFSEYEAIVLTTVRCIENAGASIVSLKSAVGSRTAAYDLADSTPGYRLTSRGKIVYAAAGSSEYDPVLAANVRVCKAQSALVEAIWAEHVAPSEIELQTMRNLTAECLRASGHDAPATPTEDELSRIAFPPDGVSEPNQPLPEWFEQCELSTALAFDVG